METSSSQSASAHLLLAALLGASVAAVSAYYVHKRTVQQLLDFKKNVDDDGDALKRRRRRHHQHQNNVSSRVRGRNSHSVPDDDSNDDGNGNVVHASAGNLASLSSSLPRLKTRREGSRQSLNPPVATIRSVPSVGRTDTMLNSRAFANGEGTDDEDELLENEEDRGYAYDDTQGDTMAEDVPAISGNNQLINSTADSNFQAINGEKDQATTNSMIKAHSISADLHGLHVADPVAADILRKEPEHETFSRLIISPTDDFTIPSVSVPDQSDQKL